MYRTLVSSVTDKDPHGSASFGKLDPDPHQSEKVEVLEGPFGLLEGPNLGKSEWWDLDPHQMKGRIRVRIRVKGRIRIRIIVKSNAGSKGPSSILLPSGFRIQHFFQLRIRIPDPDPGFYDQKLIKITVEKKINLFFIKN